MRTLFVLMAFALCFSKLQAQKCWDTAYGKALELRYPGFLDAANKTFESAKLKSIEKAGDDLLRVPVVFHIVYNEEADNLSDDIIAQQLEILNKDFQRLNDNATETRDTFLHIVGSPNIEFYLAEFDPNGQPSSGITRTMTDKSSFMEDVDLGSLFDPSSDAQMELLNAVNEIKYSSSGGIDAWDTDRYMNIWIGDLSIEFLGQTIPAILGYAFPPIEAPNWPDDVFLDNMEEIDGVVMHYEVIGEQSVGPFLEGVSGFGRALTHEAGHYFGLRHIWGDGDCEMDDGLEDTPPSDSNSQPLDLEDIPSCSDIAQKDSCTDDMMPDMVENFMDYSREICQNAFTMDQSNLMRAMLAGPRSGLLVPPVQSGIPDHLYNLMLFPNPAQHYLSIGGFQHTAADISIFDVEGSLLNQLRFDGENIDINHLSNGVYFLEINFDQQSIVKKFVIRR